MDKRIITLIQDFVNNFEAELIVLKREIESLVVDQKESVSANVSVALIEPIQAQQKYLIDFQADSDQFFVKISVKKCIYSKHLMSLKDLRKKAGLYLNLKDYVSLLSFHVSKLNVIFETDKLYTKNKTKQLILKSMTALEARLISYDNFISTHLEIDELIFLKNILAFQNNYKTSVYDFNTDIAENLLNYSVCVLDLKVFLKYVLFNRHNIIFLLNSKVKQDHVDNFAFYILKKVMHDGKFFWEMDCRLEQLTLNITDIVLPYLIEKFKGIYNNSFNDNMFRPTFNKENQILECDGAQIIKNIFLLTNPFLFCEMIRTLVVENAPYKSSTKVDKIVIFSDDNLSLNWTRENNLDKVRQRQIEITKMLFTSISDDEIDLFLSNNQ